MNTRLLLLTPLLATATLMSGCAQTDPGSAVIRYRIGNDKTCEEAGIDEIRVILDEEDGIEDNGVCQDGEFEFDGIPVGKYEVIVEGVDDNGVAIVDNYKDAKTTLNIEGDGKELTTDVIVLGDAPARVRVRWDFGFSSCEAVGIDSFLVEAFDTGGSNVLLSYEVPCSAPGEGAEGYRPVEDDDRELDGDDFQEASVRPLDSSGELVGAPVNFEFDAPGPGYTVSLTVSCDGDGCVGTGSPD